MNTLSFQVHWRTKEHGRQELREGVAPPPPLAQQRPVPARAARLLALAHRIERLVRSGDFRDYAEVATVAGLTRARISQFADLLLLAPDIQEAVLDLERPERGREPIGERDLRAIVREPSWAKQREAWRGLCTARSVRSTDQNSAVNTNISQ